MQRRKVDLPEPEGPMQARAPRRRATSRSMPLSTSSAAEALVDGLGLDHRDAVVVGGLRGSSTAAWTGRLRRSRCSSVGGGGCASEPAAEVALEVVLADRRGSMVTIRYQMLADEQQRDLLEVAPSRSAAPSTAAPRSAITLDQRGGLQHRDRLVAGRRDDHPHRLRQDDPAHRLQAASCPAPGPPRSGPRRPR